MNFISTLRDSITQSVSPTDSPMLAAPLVLDNGFSISILPDIKNVSAIRVDTGAYKGHINCAQSASGHNTRLCSYRIDSQKRESDGGFYLMAIYSSKRFDKKVYFLDVCPAQINNA